MKYFLKTLCAILVMSMLSAGFVSCGNDDDEPQQPSTKEKCTLLYLAIIPKNDMDFGKVTFSATDPVKDKTYSYTMPDNVGDDWNNSAVANVNESLKKLLSFSGINPESLFLRYIVATDATQGMKCTAKVQFTPDKALAEQLDAETKYKIGAPALLLYAVGQTTGNIYPISGHLSLTVLSMSGSALITNFDKYAERWSKVTEIDTELSF